MSIKDSFVAAVKRFKATVWNRIASEPQVTFAIVVAAVNTASDQSTKGYILAAVIALFRFAVSPALPRLP